jgi:hypothetical protein
LNYFTHTHTHSTLFPTYPFKGTHARDFMVRFSHFLASFNNRQGQGPEFPNFLKLNVKYCNRIFVNTMLSQKTHGFTPHFWLKCYVSLCVFAIIVQFSFFSEHAVYCRKPTVLLSVFANND